MEGVALKYLLDTAPWINGVTLPETVPARIRSLLDNDGMKGLCSVSLLEAATLHRNGRLSLEGTLSQFFAAGLSSDIRLIELTPAIAAKSAELLRDSHGDPFDRTILASAMVLDLTVVTSDVVMRDAKQCPVEFYPFKPHRSI